MSHTSYLWEKEYEVESMMKEEAENIGVLRLFADMAGSIEGIFERETEIYEEEAGQSIWLFYSDILTRLYRKI